MDVPAAIYQGRVVHVRKRPKRHRLDYRVFALLLDLDRLKETEAASRWFRHNRFGLLSFHDNDHGDGEGLARAWVDRLLAETGLPRPAQVELLCYPRLFGYVFNPLSIYFCRDADGGLIATVQEVHNTFGDRHAYVLPARGDAGASLVRQRADKSFFVSPFLEVAGEYRFSIRPPAENVAVVIRHHDRDGPLLDAAFHGRRAPFTSRQIWRTLLRHPMMTHKIMLAIHWEALKLWLKGVPYVGRPRPETVNERANRAEQ